MPTLHGIENSNFEEKCGQEEEESQKAFQKLPKITAKGILRGLKKAEPLFDELVEEIKKDPSVYIENT